MSTLVCISARSPLIDVHRESMGCFLQEHVARRHCSSSCSSFAVYAAPVVVADPPVVVDDAAMVTFPLLGKTCVVVGLTGEVLSDSI